jgi:hypothetical protein
MKNSISNLVADRVSNEKLVVKFDFLVWIFHCLYHRHLQLLIERKLTKNKLTHLFEPNIIPVSIRECKGFRKGRVQYPGEVVIAAAEATGFAVFGCRGWRIIGCLLIKDSDAEVSWWFRKKSAHLLEQSTYFMHWEGCSLLCWIW